ncbi:sensor histidine kinase RegB [Pacificibacter marinus]|uniref:histidine kinase n=1 Tax=Pacificibacter marinus TaxID=658057 RepID=A0A1Y5T3Z6_9RHOB|nr:ActS/PrrB/RegB family redox-sensitive histidine kinase [Pacificibacter marinus]SEL04160.1 two-component system, sensor histidine kinase RegB [Pacificibacter marinus]SLN51853.1 Sensor histidine kinase RegB [Pacificibacter marinus]
MPTAHIAEDIITKQRRSNWIRLRTLVWLRWIAIVGQIVTITVATLFLDFQLALGGFSVVIGASIIVNVFAAFVYPENMRLSERGTTLMLLFDITQLSAMLYLSGGLSNPFALLILVPVTISATALRPAPALAIGGLTIIFVTLVALMNVPLLDARGVAMVLPEIFILGNWAGIVIGVAFLGVFAWKITSEIHTMSEALLATQMALGREQKLTDLGGVVAAAAHELGTPLATIKLVSAELIDDLEDHEDLRADAQLIHEQADRCRDILRSMGRSGKNDLHLQIAPLQALVEEAADPHMSRGKTVLIEAFAGEGSTDQPHVYRHPEMIHGLRNLVQNAVDFSKSTVWIDIAWTAETISIRIIDDGTGFPASVIGKIGDPFMRRHRPEIDVETRPAYEGMGLGLFIAKTLLERTGAEISFANGSDPQDQYLHAGRRSGAIVELLWQADRIAVSKEEQTKALGENLPFDH